MGLQNQDLASASAVCPFMENREKSSSVALFRGQTCLRLMMHVKPAGDAGQLL
jgi:hypothetical protein